MLIHLARMFDFTPEQIVLLVTQGVTFAGILANFLQSRSNQRGIVAAKNQLVETTAKVDVVHDAVAANTVATVEISKNVNGKLDRALTNAAVDRSIRAEAAHVDAHAIMAKMSELKNG